MSTEKNKIALEEIENSQLQSTRSRGIPLYKKVFAVVFFIVCQTIITIFVCNFIFDCSLINDINDYLLFPFLLCELYTENHIVLALAAIISYVLYSFMYYSSVKLVSKTFIKS